MALTIARGQVLGVPPEFQDELDAVHFQTGVPKSWIAAVCEMTGWDPFYETVNVSPPGGLGGTIRQFGIAGIWADAPEANVRVSATVVSAGGWAHGYNWPGTNCSGTACQCPPLNTDQGAFSPIDPNRANLMPWYPVFQNMLAAAQILKDCDTIIQAICGERNAHIFLRWMWGCQYRPIDVITGAPFCDHYPPGIPNIFVEEIDRLIAAQEIYAEIFDEPPLLVEPINVSLSANRTTVGPGGSVTFQANVVGGSGGNEFEWSFGDGSPVETSANPTISHTYEAVGAYSARVLVRDRVNASAQSGALLITVEEGAPTGNFPWWILLVGAVGVLGLAGLSRKSKRQQAAEKRQQAQQLRLQAQQARLQGNQAKAAELDSQAMRLEQEATRLEQEAAQEEALQRQLQQNR